MCLECNRAAFVADAALLQLLLLSLLCTVFYFVLFWSLSSNNELQLELRRVFWLHCFFFLLCLIYRIHLTQLSLSLLTIVIYVAHCSTASIPLSRSLSLSVTNSLYCIPTSCTAAMVWTAFLELSFSLSLALRLSVRWSSLCWSQWGKHTVGAQWANIYAVSFYYCFHFLASLLFFLSSCRTVSVVIVVFGLFYGFFSLYLRQVQGCAFVALSASTASFIKLLI